MEQTKQTRLMSVNQSLLLEGEKYHPKVAKVANLLVMLAVASDRQDNWRRMQTELRSIMRMGEAKNPAIANVVNWETWDNSIPQIAEKGNLATLRDWFQNWSIQSAESLLKLSYREVEDSSGDRGKVSSLERMITYGGFTASGKTHVMRLLGDSELAGILVNGIGNMPVSEVEALHGILIALRSMTVEVIPEALRPKRAKVEKTTEPEKVTEPEPNNDDDDNDDD